MSTLFYQFLNQLPAELNHYAARIQTLNTENSLSFHGTNREAHLQIYKRALSLIAKGNEIMVTKGQRRLGRTIRKLENSVELSSKESMARESQKKYKEKVQTSTKCHEDAPVQSLRHLLIRKDDSQT